MVRWEMKERPVRIRSGALRALRPAVELETAV